jgi:four helix bundle protein
MIMEIKNYEDLIVWQKSMILAEEIYLVTKNFPKEEVYGLISQLRRASVSIPSNLAEGSSRRSKQEFIRFINIASGSLAELETQLMLSNRLNFVTIEKLNQLKNQTKEISKMLFALQRSLAEKQAA